MLQLSGPAVHVQVCPPRLALVESVAVTMYFVIVLPPFEAGTVQTTVAEALPRVAVAFVGAPGTVGAAASEAATSVSAAPPRAPTIRITARTGPSLPSVVFTTATHRQVRRHPHTFTSHRALQTLR